MNDICNYTFAKANNKVEGVEQVEKIRDKYIDTIKEQVKLKNVLILIFVGMVGFILGTITNMIYTYNTIERLLIR